MVLASKKGAKDKSNMSHEDPKFVKKKGKAPMVQTVHSSCAHDDHAYIPNANYIVTIAIPIYYRPVICLFYLRY